MVRTRELSVNQALPLVEAVESLGELAALTVLTPPTFPVLQQALQRAVAANTPFHVVHFDGHGVYDRTHGLGGLCFEDPQDSQKLQERRMTFVDARDMAAVVREYRIPLVFLEACQSARAEADPTASVAARLLEEGVTSVVAMSHSVLVDTARRFLQAFYAELVRGARVGQAMLAGQQAVQSYLAYRRDDGESREPSMQLCAQVVHDMRQGDTTEVAQFLAQAAVATDTPPRLQTMGPKLQAILNGNHDPALAADPTLYYRDAAEPLLLLETLGEA